MLIFLTNSRLTPTEKLFSETWEYARASHNKWLQDKIIGDPVATSTYSVEELVAMGVFGVYENSKDDLSSAK